MVCLKKFLIISLSYIHSAGEENKTKQNKKMPEKIETKKQGLNDTKQLSYQMKSVLKCPVGMLLITIQYFL